MEETFIPTITTTTTTTSTTTPTNIISPTATEKSLDDLFFEEQNEAVNSGLYPTAYTNYEELKVHIPKKFTPSGQR
jgi:hypothetical protein